jgi:hypothetical protein
MGLKQLLSEEGIEVIERAGALLLNYESLLKALDVLLANDIRVLGIEGFHLRGMSLIPDADMIVDASAATSAIESVDAIREVVTGCHDGERLYELVTATD